MMFGDGGTSTRLGLKTNGPPGTSIVIFAKPSETKRSYLAKDVTPFMFSSLVLLIAVTHCVSVVYILSGRFDSTKSVFTHLRPLLRSMAKGVVN